MKEVEVLVELTLKKTLLIELEENEKAEPKAMEVIREMTNEEYVELLTSCHHDVYVEEMTKEAKVKIAIDGFDPYVILPGVCGPSDEYDGESRRISEKIKPDMSKEKIADIIAKEFTWSFNRNFTIEECMWPAEEIYDYLIRQG